MTNVIGAIEGDGSKLFRAFYCTYRSAFPTVVIHPVFGGTEYQNLMVVATVSAAPSKAFLQEQWERLRARHPSAPNLTDAVAQRVRRADPDSRRPDPDRRLRTRRRAARGLTAAATRGKSARALFVPTSHSGGRHGGDELLVRGVVFAPQR